MNRILFFFALFLAALSATACCGQKKAAAPDLASVYENNIKDSILATGWYYIIDSDNGFQRQLDKTDEFFFIDPNPIVVKEHFDQVKIDKMPSGNHTGLIIRIGKPYRHLWAEVTERAIGARLGLIIDDRLVGAPMVQSKIEQGMSAIISDIYDLKELEDFKKRLE